MLVAWWDRKSSATASFVTNSTLQVVQSSVEAFHIHILEATCNLMDCLSVFYCEELGLDTDRGKVVDRCMLCCYLLI